VLPHDVDRLTGGTYPHTKGMAEETEWRARAFEEMLDGAIVQDDRRRFVDANQAACDLFELPRESLIGKRSDDFSPPPPGRTMDQAWSDFLERGEASGQVPLVHGDGSRIMVEYRARANIVPGRHLSVFRDVSERVIANLRADRLQQMSARLVEDPSPSSVFELVIRRGLKELGVRSGWLGLVGRTGKTICDAHYVGPKEDQARAPVAAPSEAGSIDPWMPLVEATRERRAIYLSTPEEVRARWPRLAEQTPMRACAAVPLVVRGKTVGAMALTYDEPRAFDAAERAFIQGAAQICAAAVDRAAAQRALQENEQAQRFLADAGVAFAQSLDEEETLKTVASVATRAFADWCVLDLRDARTGALTRAAVGYADPRHADLADRVRRVPRLDAPRPEYPPTRALQLGEPVLVREFDGSKYAIGATDEEHEDVIRAIAPRSLVAVPLRARGEILGLVTLVRCDPKRLFDEREALIATEFGRRSAMAIENARLYAAARRDRCAAEEASRAKDQFLAVLGHELRNPLAPIATALRFMEIRGSQVFQKERAIIERQVDHLTRLVDDLLDVSRITRGKIELRRQSVEISEVIAKAVETADPALEQRRHRLVVDLPTDPARVFGDAGRLTQVFANLLTNAAKFTPAEGTIRVTAKVDGDRVLVSVHDTGIGIAPELLSHVFETFVQGERAETVRGGLGLGLAIVKSLTELHGGSVSAHSRGAGQGSEFVVELPRLIATGSRERLEEGGCKGSPATRSVRVLIVDDNVDAAEMLGEALGAFGHVVSVAADGPSALELAAKAPPEVALLDIGLPVMDGYEVARRLREIPGCKRTRLIALTGYGQESDRERSRQAGFDQHLVKPVDLDEVTRAVAA
jgi:PAS domain S-box-containing protein